MLREKNYMQRSKYYYTNVKKQLNNQEKSMTIRQMFFVKLFLLSTLIESNPKKISMRAALLARAATPLKKDSDLIRGVLTQEWERLNSDNLTDDQYKTWNRPKRLEHSRAVLCSAMVGNVLATGLMQGNVEVWNITKRERTHLLTGHTNDIWAITIADKGGRVPIEGESLDLGNKYLEEEGQWRILTGSKDKTARIWDMKTGKCLQILREHTRPIVDIGMLSQMVITGSEDGTAKAWDMETGESIKTFQEYPSHWLSGLAVSKKNQLITVAGKVAKIWDMETEFSRYVLKGHKDRIHCILVRGNTLYTGSYDAKIREWDITTGECEHVYKGHYSRINCLAIYKGFLFSGSHDRTIRSWDIQTKEEKNGLLVKFNEEIKFIKPYNNKLFIGVNCCQMYMYDLKTNLVQILKQPNLDPFNKMIPYGKKTIVISNGSTYIWNLVDINTLSLNELSSLGLRMLASGLSINGDSRTISEEEKEEARKLLEEVDEISSP